MDEETKQHLRNLSGEELFLLSIQALYAEEFARLNKRRPSTAELSELRAPYGNVLIAQAAYELGIAQAAYESGCGTGGTEDLSLRRGPSSPLGLYNAIVALLTLAIARSPHRFPTDDLAEMERKCSRAVAADPTARADPGATLPLGIVAMSEALRAANELLTKSTAAQQAAKPGCAVVLAAFIVATAAAVGSA